MHRQRKSMATRMRNGPRLTLIWDPEWLIRPCINVVPNFGTVQSAKNTWKIWAEPKWHSTWKIWIQPACFSLIPGNWIYVDSICLNIRKYFFLTENRQFVELVAKPCYGSCFCQQFQQTFGWSRGRNGQLVKLRLVCPSISTVSYTHLTLPTNREV